MVYGCKRAGDYPGMGPSRSFLEFGGLETVQTAAEPSSYRNALPLPLFLTFILFKPFFPFQERDK